MVVELCLLFWKKKFNYKCQKIKFSEKSYKPKKEEIIVGGL
jgi:hypothetical protein